MSRKQEFSAQQMIDACHESAGIMAVVARKLGCDRATVWRYARRYKTIKAALEQSDEEMTDKAEAKLVKLINADYWPAIHYRLSTKGKARGYTERQELGISGERGGPVEIAIREVLIEMPDDDESTLDEREE